MFDDVIAAKVASDPTWFDDRRSLGASRPSWLDDHRAQELREFRARFTEEEWVAFREGRCSYAVSAMVGADGPADLLCLRSRRHGRVLCDGHVTVVRQRGEFHPHMTSVPTAVSSMDISEVP